MEKKEKALSFEQKIQKSKDILEKLMDSNISLSDSLKYYKDGTKELNEALKLLEEAKLQIKEI